MRPLHLTMQAFGPFAERESIDFAKFPQRAPFTISGPTGAGKTTILDALCLALFGQTSGGERPAAETRSQHADAKLPTEVQLIFALGNTTWRITRRPARRLGERTEAQSVQLEQQVGADQWQPAGQRVQEVDTKIRALLGFDVEQFRQVVVLPQGAFRQLLTANSAQREGILKQLFGTHLYERIQKSLNEQAVALDRDFELLAAKRQGLLASHAVQNPAELEQKLAEAAEQTTRAQQHTQVAAAHRLSADQALQAGLATAQVLRERTTTAQKLAEHQGQAPQQRQREAAVAAARRAQAAAPQVQLAAVAADQQEKAQRQVAAAHQECDGLQPKVDAATAAVANQRERSGEREALIARGAQLQALAGKVAGLAAAQSRAHQLRQQHEAAKAAVRAGQAKVQQLGEDLPKAQAEFQRLQALAAGLAGQQAEVDKLVRVKKLHGDALAAAATLQKLQVQAQAVAERRTQAAHTAQAALRDYDLCHAAWVSGQAARLALELQENQACPVCGSREHPAPAQATGQLPSDQELDQRKQSYEQARTSAEQLAREAAEAAARGDAAQQALVKAEQALADEGLPAEQASDAALRQAQAAVVQAETARQALGPTQSRAAALQAELDQARADLAQAEAGAADLATYAAAATEQVRALEYDLPQDLRTPAQLDAALADCRNRAKLLADALAAAEQLAADVQGQLASAKGSLEAKQAALAEARDEADKTAGERDQALRVQGFATLADWQAAHLAPASLAAIQAAVEAWRSQLDQLEGLAQQAAARAAGVAEPDLPALQLGADTAQAADAAAQRDLATWQGALRQLRDTQHRLAELAAQSGDLEARYAVIKELASRCNGDNEQRLPLQRFVLAGLLDDVLRAANLRLHHMTRGRYALLRTTQIVDARRAFGLDLEVQDAYTGQQRPATTLSGGEGFLASLALALGLSDVVQGYSGGIRLDALFIDEGFGTLDPETLELAIKALVDLTSGPNAAGRLVGVISHVPELKARLAKGIEVELRSDGKGSRVHVLA